MEQQVCHVCIIDQDSITDRSQHTKTILLLLDVTRTMHLGTPTDYQARNHYHSLSFYNPSLCLPNFRCSFGCGSSHLGVPTPSRCNEHTSLHSFLNWRDVV
jgi:hypothetical protein